MKRKPTEKDTKEFLDACSELHEYHGDRYLERCARAGIVAPDVLWFTSFEDGKPVTSCHVCWEGRPPQLLRFSDFYGDHSETVFAVVLAGRGVN